MKVAKEVEQGTVAKEVKSSTTKKTEESRIVEVPAPKKHVTTNFGTLVPSAVQDLSLAGVMKFDSQEMMSNLRFPKFEEVHEHSVEDYEDGLLKPKETIVTRRGVEVTERSNSTATDVFEDRAELEGLLSPMEKEGAPDIQMVRIRKLAETNLGAAIEKASSWMKSNK